MRWRDRPICFSPEPVGSIARVKVELLVAASLNFISNHPEQNRQLLIGGMQAEQAGVVS